MPTHCSLTHPHTATLLVVGTSIENSETCAKLRSDKRTFDYIDDYPAVYSLIQELAYAVAATQYMASIIPMQSNAKRRGSLGTRVYKNTVTNKKPTSSVLTRRQGTDRYMYTCTQASRFLEPCIEWQNMYIVCPPSFP